MVATILAATFLAPIVHLEAKLPKTTFQRGEKIRIEIYAVNDSNQEVVIGRCAIGNFGSGNMDCQVSFMGDNKPELNCHNPNRGQIMSGSTLHVMEDDFVVIPPKGRSLVFFEQVDGEWKDGYTPWNAPQGIRAISVPARPGEYRFAYTYTFNRKAANEALKKAAVRPGIKVPELSIPESTREIVFDGNAKARFNAAVEGKWTVTGGFKIIP
jgi:hypothetical protein